LQQRNTHTYPHQLPILLLLLSFNCKIHFFIH
jgi:hypothetical protein